MNSMSGAKSGEMKGMGYGENLLNVKSDFHGAEGSSADLQCPDGAKSIFSFWGGKLYFECDLVSRSDRFWQILNPPAIHAHTG